MTQIKSTTRRLLLIAVSVLLILCFSVGVVFASTPVLPTWTVTAHDEEFPLSLDPVVDSSSIRVLPSADLNGTAAPLNLIDLQGSISAGFIEDIETAEIDVNTLVVGLNISMKEEHRAGYNYDLTISCEGVVLIDDTYAPTDSVSIPQLVYDQPYDINVSVETENAFIQYTGQFFYGVDVGNEVFISMEYAKIETSKTQTQAVSPLAETETNNSFAGADLGFWGRSFTGKLSSTSDSDYFRIENTDSALRKITYIMNNKSSNATLRLSIYHRAAVGDTPTMIAWTSVSPNSNKYGTVYIPNYLEGTYFFVVTDYSGTASNSSYLFNANITETYTWYSQMDGEIGGIHYWNMEKLDQLTVQNASVGNYSGNFVFIDPDNWTASAARPDDVMRKACGLVSYAMMLRNENVTIPDITDYRYGTTGDTYADPFTVFLISNNLDGSEVNTTANTLSGTNLSAGINRTNISNALPNHNVIQQTAASTTAEKKTALINAVNSNIGVTIYVGGHFLVVTKYDSTKTDVNEQFIVCDPLTNNPSKGNNVAYKLSPSYASYGSILNYTALHYVANS